MPTMLPMLGFGRRFAVSSCTRTHLFRDNLPVANFVDAVLNLSAAIRSSLELAAAAAIHLAGVVVGARAGEEGGVVVDALLAAS